MRPAFPFALMLASAAIAAGPKASTHASRVVAEAKTLAAQGLRDPQSAQFRNVVTKSIAENRLLMVCGEVNAKNAYGGYVGFQRFVYVEGSSAVLLQLSDDEWQELTPDERTSAANLFNRCY
jgi:hypothetical protein